MIKLFEIKFLRPLYSAAVKIRAVKLSLAIAKVCELWNSMGRS